MDEYKSLHLHVLLARDKSHASCRALVFVNATLLFIGSKTTFVLSSRCSSLPKDRERRMKTELSLTVHNYLITISISNYIFVTSRMKFLRETHRVSRVLEYRFFSSARCKKRELDAVRRTPESYYKHYILELYDVIYINFCASRSARVISRDEVSWKTR